MFAYWSILASLTEGDGGGWVVSFLLAILWLFVAAILLGPLIRRFNLEPKSQQYFTDDPSSADPRRR